LFIPIAVILSVPFGLAGSFLFAKMFGLENNIYLQTWFDYADRLVVEDSYSAYGIMLPNAAVRE
jgi:hypothetical protein